MIDDIIRPDKKPQLPPTPKHVAAAIPRYPDPIPAPLDTRTPIGKRRIIAVVCVVLLTCLSWAVYMFIKNDSSAPVSTAPILATTAGSTQEQVVPPEVKDSLETYKVAADLPRIITVPSQDIRARVIGLGLTKDGAVDTPKFPADAGWFNGSAKPGQAGAVLIDGHVSGETSKGGVFLNLKKTKDGDTISIEKGDGSVINYKIVSRYQKPYDQVDMAKALEPYQGKNSLTIITCAGKYDDKLRTFTDRLVLYATQII